MTLQDTLLLTNNGADIATTEELGRIVVARCDFEGFSTVVTRESPVLTWKNSPFQNEMQQFEHFLEAYSAASPEAQGLILDMYHPPLSSSYPLVRKLHISARSLAEMFPQYTVDLIHKLICISASNTHQYYGALSAASQTGDLRDHEVFSNIAANDGSPSSALFSFSSKVQHSCHPNVFNFTKTADGALEYKVLRPIQKGDSLTFSYLGDLYDTPTHERRAKLVESKFFWCACERCVAPDYCRVAFCAQCQKHQPCQAIQEAKDEDVNWTCPLGHSSRETTRNEHGFERDLQMTIAGQQADGSTANFYSIRNKSISTLSPTHYVTIRAWKELARLYASKAHLVESVPPPNRPMIPNLDGLTIDQLRQVASIAGLRAVSLCECVANQCLGCDPGPPFRHAALHDMSTVMFHACSDLLVIPAEMRPPYSREMVKRYLPMLKATFGETDSDVAAIERVLLQEPGSNRHVCDCCLKLAPEGSKLLSCGRCKLFSYCSKSCQIRHWKVHHHKLQCVPIVKNKS